MKFLAVILSFCFLGFISPSYADTDCNAKAEQEISSCNDHQQHEHSDEDCSSSCLGYCCTNPILFQNLSFSLSSSQISESLDCPEYHKLYFKELSSSIWQPPKIA